MRTHAEKKMLDAMADPAEREALLDLLKNRCSRGQLVSSDRLIECGSHGAFDALLRFEYMIEEEIAALAERE